MEIFPVCKQVSASAKRFGVWNILTTKIPKQILVWVKH